MAGGTRSHSPPLPPNASYTHPVIALNILPSAKMFLAGSKLTGMLEVVCKEKNSVALGQLAIEFFGIEELKLLDHSAQSSIHGPHKCIFQGPALPPSNAVVTSEAPIGGHYYTALRGRTKFPFSFPLPSKLPSSTDFDGKARVSYALKATCQVLSIQSRQNVLVTKSRAIQVVEKMLDWADSKYHEAVEMRAELREALGNGAGVWAEVKIDKMLHYNQNSSLPDDGLIRAQLTVKNNSRRILSGGVNAKICRKLVLPNDPPSLNDVSRIQVVRNCTFRGTDYEFPSTSSQAKTVKLICQLPSSSPSNADDVASNVFCASARGMKLFSIDMFLRVELELGALSNDLVVDLPIYVTHPSSLPKELLIRNTPITIEHIPSSNPLSISHLSEPRASGRVSRNTSRSSSPHPPSLQPGNISRSASPRSSLCMAGDWGMGTSCPSSPVQVAHFSPLPTPRHSPLPSARFSSPLPVPSSSATPSNHLPASRVVPEASVGLPALSWPNGQPASHSPDQYRSTSTSGFSSYPPQFDSRHYPAPSQPMFSPPATPWPRQASSAPTPFDPNPTCASSMLQSSHAHQAITSSRDVVLPLPPLQNSYTQESFHPSAYHASDTESGMRSPWRIRHQSLPTIPVPQHHHNNSANQYHGTFDQGRTDDLSVSSQKPANSRRTSEPISSQPVHPSVYSQSTSAGPIIRKRALPTPPKIGELTGSPSHEVPYYQNGLCHAQDHQQNTAPLSNDQLHINPHVRLETIGEIGESQPGSLSAKRTPCDTLSSLVTGGDAEDSGEDDNRHPRRWKPTRVVSQPRGMRPRRSDGSESVQNLEDIVSKEDERRSAGGAPDMTFDQSSTMGKEYVDDDDICRRNQEDSNHSFQTSSRINRNSLPAAHAHGGGQPTHPTGLANLVHFLKRASSAEPPRSSSAQEMSTTGLTSNDNNVEEHIISQPSDDDLARTSTPNYAGSALRIKSTRISYGEIDAVPSTSHTPKASLESDSASTTSASKSDWKPPSTLISSSVQASRKSLVEHINLYDENLSDEVPGRESIAPEALFPQFHPELNGSVKEQADSNINSDTQGPPPSSTVPLPSAISHTRLPKQPSPLLIPSDCPLVKKKSPKPSRKTSQPKRTLVHDSQSLPSRDESESASLPRSPLDNAPTIVERLRSQYASSVDKTSHAQLTKEKDRDVCEISKLNNPTQLFEKHQSSFNVVGEAEHLSHPQNDVIQLPPSLPQSHFKLEPIQNNQTQIFPSLSRSDRGSLPFPSPSRLSAIPRSSNPLSLNGSNCYSSSSGSIPHRPLPISPNVSHNSAMSQFDSAAVFDSRPNSPAQVPITHDANVSTRALFAPKPTQTSPKETTRELITSSHLKREAGGGGHLKTKSLGAPSSPTSPTNLSRKSRIKRQVSSTNTTHGNSTISNVSSERGASEGVFTINRVPGGWNEDETNEIEAQLMEALKETNLAVQKATSKRLSTPQFSKSPTLNRARILSNISASVQSEDSLIWRSNRIEPNRFRASMSIVESPRNRSSSVNTFDPPSHEPDASVSPDWSNDLHTDETLQCISFDEDTPIRLTSREYKSMRGGRGGRVSSVVGQWAKLTSADDGVATLSERDPIQFEIDKSSFDETISKPSHHIPASTRGISIKPKKSQDTSSYSITGALSRNSSLISRFSLSKPLPSCGIKTTDKSNERRTSTNYGVAKENVTEEPKLRFIESTVKSTPLQIPRNVLPSISKNMTSSEIVDRRKENNVAIGYRNLANRLSGGISSSTNTMAKSASSSSSTSSISSLASSVNNFSSFDNELQFVKKLNNNKFNRVGIIGGADRNKHHSIHPGFPVGSAISDLVKKWET